MYKPRDIIELIADNVKKTGNPFGAPRKVINRWWKNLSLPREGSALLFTGLMYQSVPFIEKTTARGVRQGSERTRHRPGLCSRPHQL